MKEEALRYGDGIVFTGIHADLDSKPLQRVKWPTHVILFKWSPTRPDFEVDVNTQVSNTGPESEVACVTQSTPQPEVHADPPNLGAQNGAAERHKETVLGTLCIQRKQTSIVLPIAMH